MSELRNLPGDPLDAVALQRQFPVLQRSIKGHRMAFLDSAAPSQKPQRVIDAMSGFYETINANVHRGVYEISEQATNALEGVRSDVARFIGASDVDEVVFTKNATESLNLVAGSWGRANLGPGDAIVLTMLEHHANIVPWQMLASERGFDIRWIPLTEDAQLDLGNLDTLLDGAKLVGLTAASNVTGTLTPFDASLTPLTTPVRSCASTPASTCHTPPATSTRSAPIFWRSPATRCAGRPASVCCGPDAASLRTCPRFSVAVR